MCQKQQTRLSETRTPPCPAAGETQQQKKKITVQCQVFIIPLSHSRWGFKKTWFLRAAACLLVP